MTANAPWQTRASILDQPIRGQGAPIRDTTPPPALPVTHTTRLSRGGRSTWLWVWGVVLFALFGLVSYFLGTMGREASIIGLIVALVPFAGVVAVVLWVDRWEPEPRTLLVFAILWGAVIAVAISLGADLLFRMVVPPSPLSDVFSTVVKAPIVEELAKGLGLLILVAMGRRAFDGPVDGVVYGALVGAGFALTENVQYFAVSLIEGGAGQLGLTFFMRGVLSPFAHAMFTCVIGFAVGLAVARGRTVFGAWVAGTVVGIVLHGIWNGTAVFADGLGGFFMTYLMLQVPLFIVFMVILIRLRREEERLTNLRLGEYAQAGWFTPNEVTMLATPAGRKAGRAWAKSAGPAQAAAMRSFIRTSTSLAASRQRALSGRDPNAQTDERALLERATALRTQMLA